MSAFPPAPLSFVNHGHGTRTCLNFDFALLLLLHFHYYYYLTLTFTDTLGFMPHITQPAIRPKSVALEPIIVEPREADERALWLNRQNQVSGGRSAGAGAGAAVAAKAAAARQSSGVVQKGQAFKQIPDHVPGCSRPANRGDPPSIIVGALVHRSVVLSKQLIDNCSAPAHLLRCGRSALLTCESEICCKMQPRQEQFQRVVKAGRCA